MTTASIPSPSENGFHIGPLFLHAYGIAYVFAVSAAILISRVRWERRGGNREMVYECAMWGFPAGIIGGRIYFIITTYSQMPHHWWGPFAIWDGGLGIWGGIAGGAAAGIWRLRRRGVNVAEFMDVAAPGLLVAQAIGRIGNYFNQELFGKPTTLPWALQISPAHRPAGYLAYKTFQPTFLYELLFDVALAVFLIWLGSRRGRIRAPGLFALYVAGYSGFRMFEETLRIDYSHHVLGLRLNFFVALVLCVAALVWFARIQWGWPGRRRIARAGGAVGLVWVVLAAAGCGFAGRVSSARAAGVAAAPSTGVYSQPARPSASRAAP
jgi:prolipoprotein diacylglyceryl transferase